MTVYVDEINDYPRAFVGAAARKYGTRWCHMTADDEAELHAMAERLGLRRTAFHRRRILSHYDLTPSKRAQAIRYGAQEARAQDLVRRAMGLGGVRWT